MLGSLDKKIHFITIFLLFIFSIIIITLLYLNLQNQKEYLIKDAKNKTQSIAKFVSSDIDRLIFGVEELIEGIHNVEEHMHYEQDNNQNINKLLLKNMRPYVMDILIVNKDAQIIHWTNEGEKPNIKDREYIKYHLKNKNPETFIGMPKLSKVHKNKWFFAISKSHMSKTGTHIIVFILDLDYFNIRYEDNLMNSNSSIFVGAQNGQIYARYPYGYKYIGKKVNEIEKFANTNLNKKHFTIPSPLDKKERIATLVKSDIYPIIVGSTVLTKDILAPWEELKRNTLIISFLLSLGFMILIIYYIRLQKKLVLLSQTDSLTKLLNRGSFTKLAKKEFKRAKRFNEEFCILMLDIDDFKKINDNFGHQKGDIVIKKLANTIDTNIREIDLSARYGGEEFIVLLINTTKEDSFKAAKRIKDSFFRNKENHKIQTSVSIGIASWSKHDNSLEDIIKRADNLLYVSKKNGKNTISI